MRILNRTSLAFAVLALVFLAGCSSQVPLGVDSANPSANVGAEAKGTQEQEQLVTEMKPRAAALAAESAANEKYGLAVGPGSANEFSQVSDQTISGDGFSAHGVAFAVSGKTVTIDCEWFADGKTNVTLTSDLPPAQYAAVEQVIRAALAANTK